MYFHCGYKPMTRQCNGIYHSYSRLNPSDEVEIGYHWYWGVDYMKFPPAFQANYGYIGDVESIRKFRTELNFSALWMWFFGAFVIAAIRLQIYYDEEEKKPPSPSSSGVPTEAEIAERLHRGEDIFHVDKTKK